MLARLLALLLLLAGGLSLALQGIGVAPTRAELTMAPGERATLEVRVFTTETAPLQVFTRVVDWGMKPDGTVVELPSGANRYSALPWLEAALDPFEIREGKERLVRIAVRVPDDPGLSGSYWAAVQFITTPPNQSPGSTVLIRVAANYIVYVTLSGTERPEARIVRFERVGNQLVLDVENTGNTYLRLEGGLRFLNESGEVVAEESLPERVVLRDGLARIILPLPEDLPKEAVLAAVQVWAKKPVPLPEQLYADTPLR